MKNKTMWRILTVLLMAFVVCGGIANAQKRRTPKTRTTRTSQKTLPAAANSKELVKTGAEKVSNQIKNLTQFIYLLGGSNVRIGSVSNDEKRGKVTTATKQQIDAGKKGLVLTIQSFKGGLKDLEASFRATNDLKPYLLELTGVADLAQTAEEQAAANQFDAAGRTLIEIVGQLADVLRAMP
ncbi:MAG: hypothetical protein H7Z37_01595 [Pyrinomonadaceae bacterium]|nr:hypothetical protein [Pyrinomonadaceae bacterium]